MSLNNFVRIYKVQLLLFVFMFICVCGMIVGSLMGYVTAVEYIEQRYDQKCEDWINNNTKTICDLNVDNQNYKYNGTATWLKEIDPDDMY